MLHALIRSFSAGSVLHPAKASVHCGAVADSAMSCSTQNLGIPLVVATKAGAAVAVNLGHLNVCNGPTAGAVTFSRYCRPCIVPPHLPVLTCRAWRHVLGPSSARVRSRWILPCPLTRVVCSASCHLRYALTWLVHPDPAMYRVLCTAVPAPAPPPPRSPAPELVVKVNLTLAVALQVATNAVLNELKVRV